MGNRLRSVITGGAATSDTVKTFIHECFGLKARDGYATTEVGTVAVDGIINKGVDGECTAASLCLSESLVRSEVIGRA